MASLATGGPNTEAQILTSTTLWAASHSDTSAQAPGFRRSQSWMAAADTTFAQKRASPMVSGLYSPRARPAALQSSWKSTVDERVMRGVAPRGARRGLGVPSVNIAAQTHPKAKMTPTNRYVHSNRISDRFSGASQKPSRNSRRPGPADFWNAASRRCLRRRPPRLVHVPLPS